MVFDKKVQVLEIQETEPGKWEWVEVGKAWTNPSVSSKTNLFSKVGVGARSANFLMHPRKLTEHNALRWQDKHYFITSIRKNSVVEMEVEAALVQVRGCAASHPEEKDTLHTPLKELGGTETISFLAFPAVLTEKYMGFTQQSPMSRTEQTFVLVTPKAITLETGDLVEVEGMGKCAVQICHTLDEYKNEYEVHRKEDA